MKTRIKIVAMVVLGVMGGLALPRAAAAVPISTPPSPITIDGVVYDEKHKPVAGVTVVAWCGGIDFFGGSDATDANGHYLINTNSEACPFANELTVTTDVDYDGGSDGARHTQVHTQTTINIYLGDYTSVVIPEYGWIGASVALLAGIGVIGFMRRAQLSKPARVR